MVVTRSSIEKENVEDGEGDVLENAGHGKKLTTRPPYVCEGGARFKFIIDFVIRETGVNGTAVTVSLCHIVSE